MDERTKATARQVLSDYLETRGHRKTPERYAILDAVYSHKGRFTLESLSEELDKSNFRVSRATFYNTLKLFIGLQLVVRYRLPDGTWYDASYEKRTQSYQVCTQCGRTKELSLPQVIAAIDDTHLKRFRKEGFVLYVYGICSTCQAKLTRKKTAQNRNKQ